MIEKKQFGRTGHMSSRVIFGAAALAKVSQKEADETYDLLKKYDINHIDTAHSYGEAELRIGPWMKRDRSSFFLATKTEKRTKGEALDELQQSLEKLQTDHIDLWQFHFLVDEHQWEIAMGEGGVLEAAIEAKKQGLIRYIGVTGHGLGAS
ncbi:MAG TPA: aldo/keto reductase, partial [Sphaerochaeta sp.]|nr:aldo/keto reductase [Sphaerochaeta sp.]